MDLGALVDSYTAEALLNDNQPRIVELAIGKHCPDCGSDDVECIGDDFWCRPCDDTFRPLHAAVKKLQDLGYNVYAED